MPDKGEGKGKAPREGPRDNSHRQNRGKGHDSPRYSAGGTSKGNVSEDTEAARRRLWRKEGRCLSCGSETHHIKDCKLAPKESKATVGESSSRAKSGPNVASAKSNVDSRPSLKAKGAKVAPAPQSKVKVTAKPSFKDRSNDTLKVNKSSGKRATPSSGFSKRGDKRSRDMSPSGFTPPMKKATNFSYATVSNSAIAMVILNNEGNHVAIREHNRLRTQVEERWIDQLNKGEDLVAVERWEYTTRTATVFLEDSTSVETVRQEAEKPNLRLMPKAQYESERPETNVLTGLITGPAAKRDRKDLERFLKAEVDRVKIPGHVSVFNTTPIERSGNTLLRISVCANAMEKLKLLEFQLRIGASGYVKFEDTRASKKLDRSKSRKAKMEELHKKIAEDKKKIQERLKELKDLEKADTESIGSMGVSNLDIDQRDNVEAMEEEELLKTDDEASNEQGLSLLSKD